MSRESEISTIKAGLNIMEYRIKERDDVIENLKFYENRKSDLSLARGMYEADLNFTTNGIVAFKTDRLLDLNSGIESVLDKVFPGENFEVRLEPVHNYLKKKDFTKLKIGKDGVYSSMKDQNGRMCRQSVAFKINTKIQTLTGALPVIIDEALNSGDIDSTASIGEIIHELTSTGVQVILIEHKKQLYENLPRRQFNFVKDTELECVTEVKVVDHDI